MSDKLVKVIIDDVEYEVPAGMNLVDAAKWHAKNDIPVFCYHPKMDPVGMCRMCLVEMGTIQKDRETGQVMLDEQGKPQVRWMPKLQTSCTQGATDGLVIRTATEQVREARENVIEFLLTSHPLDCPICDKGGECPLQNLTMEHGAGTSRMYFDDKMRLDKRVPLGDLIVLDEERCIQCGRCVRYQDEIIGDDVLAFHERGRTLQIITNSEPGFDSYFSGNTTDICPVGALTTVDFRFGARPWELTEVPSIDPYDAAGSNISLSIRLDRDFGGKAMIKRVMPRQNEYVNELWISDKTRFGHHFTRSEQRLQAPMLRTGDVLQATQWQVAMNAIVEALKGANGDVAAVAGSGMSNEDLWALNRLVKALGGERLGAWPYTHAGADLLAQVGVGEGSNLGKLGKGDAVLIIASDLEEEVPIWRLRLKQAADRGAYLVVANARSTRMDDFASETLSFGVGKAAHFMNGIRNDEPEVAQKLADANNLVIVAGAEGLTLDGSRALMQAAANFLIETGHVGKPNNGLLATLPGANGMGQFYMGFSPEATQAIAANPPKVLIAAQAEILADDPYAATWLSKVETIISFNLFVDAVAGMAKVVLPLQSFAERDGTFTSGERRVQRFYTAQGPMGEALPAWLIFSRLLETLGQGKAKASAAAVMAEISEQVPAFEGMRYRELAKTERQFPDITGDDNYYGGTAYQNKGGLGKVIPTAADKGEVVAVGAVDLPATLNAKEGQVLVIPTTMLYNRESTFKPSTLVHPRVLAPFAEINAVDASKMNVVNGDVVEIRLPDLKAFRVRAHVNGGAPRGTVILPRHLTDEATPMTPLVGEIRKAQP